MADPRHTLSSEDFAGAAWYLGCEPAAIRAVVEVEAPRGGFDDQGRPTILFERHWFHRLTGGKYSATHPEISNQKPGGYGKHSQQHERLELAASLDREAAIKSTSWGAFQIMGFNHAPAGHPTLQGFVNAMYRSAGDQLRAFIRFIESCGLAGFLRRKEWPQFSERFNGPNYKINQHDTKLEAAYGRFVAN